MRQLSTLTALTPHNIHHTSAFRRQPCTRDSHSKIVFIRSHMKHYWRRRMSVPAPPGVKSSSSKAFRTLPSKMMEASTPALTASKAVLTLGIMPPKIVPSSINSSTCTTRQEQRWKCDQPKSGGELPSSSLLRLCVGMVQPYRPAHKKHNFKK